MTKTILCAVDINNPREDGPVLARAKELAEMDEAQLDVMTVMPDFGSTMVSAYFKNHDVKSARDGAEKVLRDFAEDILGAEMNANVRHLVGVGTVYAEVLKAARISGADLIVIGASRPDLKDYLLGPNASRVVRHSDCSVYVVR